MRLAEPVWLLALVLTPLPWLAARAGKPIDWPSIAMFAGAPRGLSLFRFVPRLLRSAAIACLAVGLARPQVVGGRTRVAARGVAIVVAIDRSSSMTADDAGPPGGPPLDRLEAARRAFAGFVDRRPDDLIGLVAFANAPDLIGPPTLDHAFLDEALAAIRPAWAGEDGTNLAHAVAWGLDALRKATPRRKVLVLVTDGRDNPASAAARPIDPEGAAALARDLGVTLHTIAVGPTAPPVEPRTGLALPDQGQGADLALLVRMAEIGGGKAFVAAGARELDRAARAIDDLERSPIVGTVHVRYREAFAPWAVAALLALAVDLGLVAGRLRALP